MPYSLATLWHERQRFLPGVLAVMFSALLIALQCGLLLGLFSITSIPVDRTTADIWVGSPAVLSVDLGRPIREDFLSRLQMQPEVEATEYYLQGFAYWTKPNGGSELSMVIGSSLEPDALGLLEDLKKRPDLLQKLTEPGAIVIDKSEFDRLGIEKVGDLAKISDQNVRVVGTLEGVKSLAGPYVFCSRETARPLLRLTPDQTTYVLARCSNPEAVVSRMNDEYGPGFKITDKSFAALRDANVSDTVLAKLNVVKDRRFNTEKQLSSELASILTKQERNNYQKSILEHAKSNGDMVAFTQKEFSSRTQLHWLTKTKAGIALGCAAALGLLVGAVVTSQTLYAATAAAMREYAVLRALGIPRWRMAASVLEQSFWVGALGIVLAIPVAFGLAASAELLNVPVPLPWWLVVSAAVVTLGMALLAGLLALRSLRLVEPAVLLR